MYHERTKHINVRFLVIKEAFAVGIMEIVTISKDYNALNKLAKALVS